GGDRLSILGVEADLPGEGEERQGTFEVEVVRIPAARDGRALRLDVLVFALVAELHVGAEAARAQRDVLAGFRIGAEQLAVGAKISRAVLATVGELSRVTALRIVGAT